MELLTGKCLANFKEYLSKNTRQINIGMIQFDLMEYEVFKQIGIKAQYGVLVDFFDSVNIHIDALKVYNCLEYKYFIEANCSSIIEEDGFSTRPEACKEAIKEANELYNERK